MKNKTLGQIAFEAAYADMGETYEWDLIPVEEHGHWEASAQAVVAEYERRKASSSVPTDKELALWESTQRVSAINSYKRRTGSSLSDAYTAISNALSTSKEAVNE